MYADKQREESPFVSVNNLIQPKKVDSIKKKLEGNGVSVANSTVDSSNYEMFEADFEDFIDLAEKHGFIWQGPGDLFHFGIPSQSAGYKDKYEAIRINQEMYKKGKYAY